MDGEGAGFSGPPSKLEPGSSHPSVPPRAPTLTSTLSKAPDTGKPSVHFTFYPLSE